MPALQDFHDDLRRPGAGARRSTSSTPTPAAPWRRSGERGVTYPSLADPGGDLQAFDEFAKIPGMPTMFFVDADGAIAYRAFGGVELGGRGRRPGRRAPRGRAVSPDLPDWLRPVEEAARSITVHDLTRFMPPEDEETRVERGADALRRGPRRVPTCCSPSAATRCAPTPARCPSRAARSTRARPPGRRRCARPGRRPGSTASGVDGVRRAAAAVAAAEQLLGHPGAGLVARAERRCSVVSPDEVHAVYRVPLARAARPRRTGSPSPARRLAQPGLPDRRRTTTSSAGGSPPG